MLYVPEDLQEIALDARVEVLELDAYLQCVEVADARLVLYDVLQVHLYTCSHTCIPLSDTRR